MYYMNFNALCQSVKNMRPGNEKSTKYEMHIFRHWRDRRIGKLAQIRWMVVVRLYSFLYFLFCFPSEKKQFDLDPILIGEIFWLNHLRGFNIENCYFSWIWGTYSMTHISMIHFTVSSILFTSFSFLYFADAWNCFLSLLWLTYLWTRISTFHHFTIFAIIL